MMVGRHKANKTNCQRACVRFTILLHPLFVIDEQTHRLQTLQIVRINLI